MCVHAVFYSFHTYILYVHMDKTQKSIIGEICDQTDLIAIGARKIETATRTASASAICTQQVHTMQQM